MTLTYKQRRINLRLLTTAAIVWQHANFVAFLMSCDENCKMTQKSGREGRKDESNQEMIMVCHLITCL